MYIHRYTETLRRNIKDDATATVGIETYAICAVTGLKRDKEWEGIVHLCNKVIVVSPDVSHMFLAFRAEAYLENGDPVLAVLDCTKALHIKEDLCVRITRMKAFKKAGKRNSALSDCDVAMKCALNAEQRHSLQEYRKTI